MSRILFIHPWRYQDASRTTFDLSREWRNAPYSLLLLGGLLKQKGHKVMLADLARDLVVNRGAWRKA